MNRDRLPLLLLLAVACAPAPWTAEGALSPHLARLDTNGDGRVTDAEYARTRREGPPFASADHDSDGALDPRELAWLVRAQQPATFDGEATLPPPGLPEGVLPGGGLPGGDLPDGAPDRRSPTGEARHVWELLVWMGDAVRSTGRAGPEPAAVEAAVRSGRLDSAETRAVLGTLRSEWEAAGWRWPELGG